MKPRVSEIRPVVEAATGARGVTVAPDIWDRLQQLNDHLGDAAQGRQASAGAAEKSAAQEIKALEKRLDEVVDWEKMPREVPALRRKCGLSELEIPDILVGLLSVGSWLWLTSVTKSWVLGLVLTVGAIVIVRIFMQQARANGLQTATCIGILRFVEHVPTAEFPWSFECIEVGTDGKPGFRDWHLQGLKNAPSSGYLLGIFSPNGDSLGYIEVEAGRCRIQIWDSIGGLLPQHAVRPMINELLEQEVSIRETVRDLLAKSNDAASVKTDLARMREQWNKIVLPADIKEHLLRAILLFAHGDKAAPKGILLKGPPGTGKSMLASVIAASVEMPMIKLSVADVKGEVIGASGANVRRLWENALKDAPAIIFIDECEGVFVTRGSDQGDSFSNEIVQAFLTEWDGIGGERRILVIGATNRPELLDPAVMSRFSDVVELNPPKAESRIELITSIADQLGFKAPVPETACRLMDGLAGREVRNILQQAQRLALPGDPELAHYQQAAGKVRGKSATRTDHGASWESLILPEATKQRLKTMCQMVKESEALVARGIPVPQSLLLYGPPGTGKTQIARTFANESGLGFMARSTADLKGQYLGHAAGRIAQTFEAARNISPCILFIDEIDALTSSRSGENQDQLQTEALTQLLQELDGVAAKPGHVFVMAATNRLDSMDPAILSRFSQKLEIGLPGQVERKAILQTLLLGRPVDQDMDLDELARNTDGYSGRDLREMISAGFNRAVERALANGHAAQESRLAMVDLRSPE